MPQSNLSVLLSDLGLEFIYPESYEPSNPNTNTFIDTIKKINKIPFSKGEYYYSDDFWDFSKYTTLNITKKTLKFNFNLCCETFKDDLKNYVLLQILENSNKIQTTHKEFRVLYNFFNHAESKGFYHIKDITDKEIQSFLDIYSYNSIPTQRFQRSTMKKFYSYYAANFEDLITPTKLKLFEHESARVYYTHKENNKIPDIPKEYFDKFLAACIKIANDETDTKLHRAIACMYIIISQTGLRVGECLGLEIDSLETVSIFNGEKAYYIKYKTWKSGVGNNTCTIQRTYVNELTKKAYDTLIELYKDDRKKNGLSYLYLGSTVTINKNAYPIDPNSFGKAQATFCGYLNKYFEIINIDDSLYPGITRKKISSLDSITRHYPNAKTIAMPKNHQFRVHVCTELYKKGVPLKYIQKFMAHLSNEMEGYYVRPTKKNPQEDMDFTLDTLKKIVTGETKLLGGNASLIEKINQFIKENNYNVSTDLNEICKKLAAKIPIRQKTGGVCIKSSILRECSKDAKTNEFYCSYGVCPNIFHFYYMANISYRQTKELVETIKINKERGLMRQVQKENHMLQTIIKQKLLPELDELKNMVNKKGIEAILLEYPDLQFIIENLKDIYMEVDIWKNMI